MISTPATIETTTAAMTPSQTRGNASRRPILTRYAATMPTMSAASRPSRSVIRKAGIMRESQPRLGRQRKALLTYSGHAHYNSAPAGDRRSQLMHEDSSRMSPRPSNALRVAGLAAVAAILGACTAAPAGSAGAGARVPVTVTASGCEPASLSVPAGPVVFEVTNDGAETGEFEIISGRAGHRRGREHHPRASS